MMAKIPLQNCHSRSLGRFYFLLWWTSCLYDGEYIALPLQVLATGTSGIMVQSSCQCPPFCTFSFVTPPSVYKLINFLSVCRLLVIIDDALIVCKMSGS